MPDDVFLERLLVLPRRARRWNSLELVEEIAARLFGLGFPDLALSWLSPVGRDAPAETRLLAAQALVALRDAPAAMTLLEGLDGPEQKCCVPGRRTSGYSADRRRSPCPRRRRGRWPTHRDMDPELVACRYGGRQPGARPPIWLLVTVTSRRPARSPVAPRLSRKAPRRGRGSRDFSARSRRLCPANDSVTIWQPIRA